MFSIVDDNGVLNRAEREYGFKMEEVLNNHLKKDNGYQAELDNVGPRIKIVDSTVIEELEDAR